MNRRVVGIAAAVAAAAGLACAGARSRPAEVSYGEPEVVEGAPDPDRMPPPAALERAAQLAREGAPGEAEALLARLSARPGLEPAFRARALIERGVLQLDAGAVEPALASLRDGLAAAAGAGPGAVAPSVLANGRFYLGEALRARSERAGIDASLPPRALAEALEQRADGLLAAQRAYLEAGAAGDPEVAVAAGARVGELYEALRRDLLAAPPPPDLDRDEAERYAAEVRTRTRVLAEKALQAWDATLDEAAKRGIASDWLARVEASRTRLRTELAREGAR